MELKGFVISIVPKGKPLPLGTSKFIDNTLGIKYSTHVQSYGWQEFVENGSASGTEGEAKRLEGIKINLDNPDDSRKVRYRTHVELM